MLARAYSPSPEKVGSAADAYRLDPSPENLVRLQEAIEPGRQELFRRLNQEEGTTIIQVTHSETNAEYGHRVIELFDGWISSERRTSAASGFAG